VVFVGIIHSLFSPIDIVSSVISDILFLISLLTVVDSTGFSELNLLIIASIFSIGELLINSSHSQYIFSALTQSQNLLCNDIGIAHALSFINV